MGLIWGSGEGYPQPENFILALCFALGSFFARFLLDRFVYKAPTFIGPIKGLYYINCPPKLLSPGKLHQFDIGPCAMRLLGYKAALMMNDADKLSKIVKCTESMWKLTYYAAVEIWIFSIIKHEPWSLDTKQYFKGWPKQELKSSVMLFYMCQCGFYVYSIVALVAWETRRKDFSIMMSHHIVTSILIGFSYITRFFRIGTIILALHDASDVFLEAAKLFKYSEKELAASLCFGFFATSWLLLRLVYFPFWIIKSSSYDSIEALSWMDKFPTMLYYIFNMMLLTLLVFHIYWWKLIFVMILKQLGNRGKVGEDIRSDSEDEN